MRPLLSVIVPTIAGREQSLRFTLDAYRQSSASCELVTVRDRPNWPAACNEGAQAAAGRYLHFTADDVIPRSPDWWQPAVQLIERDGELPAARVLECRASLPAPEWYDDGADGDTTAFSRVPLLSREQYDLLGPWPEIDYYADLWLSAAARTVHGIETRNVWGYSFNHYWSEVGRIDTPERLTAARAEYDRLLAGMGTSR